jgi:hypothetical protein
MLGPPTTMKEFLTWYNNKDVVPMLEALEKMFQFNQNRHIDMFKDSISVPGLTLKYMFQDLPDYSTLPDEKNKDLYDLCKNNIVGGPRIVFHNADAVFKHIDVAILVKLKHLFESL